MPRNRPLIVGLSKDCTVTSTLHRAALLALTASEMLGVIIEPGDHWRVMTDHLIAWDVPAPPGYLDVKKRIVACENHAVRNLVPLYQLSSVVFSQFGSELVRQQRG